MKIAIIGSGAMGMLFGGLLSRHNDVVLIDIDQSRVNTINQDGIRIVERNGRILTARPKAFCSTESLEIADLVILFVKSMQSRNALEASRRLLGPGTYVLSLQNGSGHESVLREFVSEDRIVIGVTQHNSSVIERATVQHGGGGKTYIGPISGDAGRIEGVVQVFNRCGLETEIPGDLRRKVWEKLFLNSSASVLSAVLQTNLGFLIESESAWQLMRQLIREAVAVANGEGVRCEENEVLGAVRKVIENARTARTSIYADIRQGRKTEVDTISGAVVSAGKRHQIPVPCHEFVVRLVHALEERQETIRERLPDGQIESN